MLGTPPAFILSQDQTLILSVLSFWINFGFPKSFTLLCQILVPVSPTCFKQVACFRKRSTFRWLLFLRVCELLHTFFETFLRIQGCFIVKLSRFCLVHLDCSAVVRSSFYILSHCFVFVNNFFNFFYFVCLSISLIFDSVDSISLVQPSVKNFFQIFSYFLKYGILKKVTEKEGFEPSRRSPDLHP